MSSPKSKRAKVQEEDSGPTFTFKLSATECKSMKYFTATCHRDGTQLGSLSARLINMKSSRGSFFQTCDSDSEELISAGRSFFSNDCALREPLRSAVVDKSAVEKGGFLYVFQVDVVKTERGKVLALGMLAASFEHLKDRVSLSAMLPAPWSEEDRQTNVIADRPKKIERIARHFARLGFRQVAAQSDFIFVEKRCIPAVALPKLPPSQVVMTLAVAAESDLTPLDLELRKAMRGLQDPSTGGVQPGLLSIGRLIGLGASADRSHALHFSSISDDYSSVLSFLLSPQGGAATVDLLDEGGVAALEIAVSSDAESNVRLLLEAGASPAAGFKELEKQRLNMEDFRSTFNLSGITGLGREENQTKKRIRALLSAAAKK